MTNDDKKKGATPCESAPQTDIRDSIAHDDRRERGLFLPLAWAELGKAVKPQPFRGKAKRKSRAAAINAKGNQGAVDINLAGLIVLALVAGALLVGVA